MPYYYLSDDPVIVKNSIDKLANLSLHQVISLQSHLDSVYGLTFDLLQFINNADILLEKSCPNGC